MHLLRVGLDGIPLPDQGKNLFGTMCICGSLIADIVAIIGTMDIVLGEIDR